MTIHPPPCDFITSVGIGGLAWVVAGVGVWVFARGQRSLTVRLAAGMLWAWNLWGSWCLAVIPFIAIASSPMVRLFGDGAHVNTWVLFVPYVWLPIVLVTAALFGHIVMTRALLSGRVR